MPLTLIHELSALSFDRPANLTIGSFDGVHLGHQAILKQLVQLSQKEKCKSVVLTFENHPSTVLKPEQPVFPICTTEHKLQLLEKAGIDYVILLKFTKELSELSAEEFLTLLFRAVPCSTLVLGYDATLGNQKQGGPDQVRAIVQKWNANVIYFPVFQSEGITVSSTEIRKLIKEKNFALASKLLGRPYSIYAPVITGESKGKAIGFPTANIDVSTLCHPPFGVYAVQILHHNKLYNGVANLGIAPTVRKERVPRLEIHLLDQTVDLYGDTIEVIFRQYLRPEMKFPSVKELRDQIENDILQARKILS